MAVTTVPVLEDIPGSVHLDAIDLNRIMQAIGFLTDLPRWTVHQETTATSLLTGVWTSIGMDAQELISDHVTHSTTTNNSQVTIQVPGVYELSGKVSFGSNTTGRRLVRWLVNGSAILASEISMPPASAFPMVPAAVIRTRLAVGDYVEIQADQDSGGTINTQVGQYTTVGSYMSGRWVGQ